MTEVPATADSAAGDGDTTGHTSPSFDIPSNKYADIFGLWPPELFDGFEEFVKQRRQRSAERREPPPWW
jgi:hypothetical protein